MNHKRSSSKILIDSVSLLSSLTGIGRYTSEISKYLEKELELTYFYGYYSHKRIEPSRDNGMKSLKAFFSSVPLLKKTARKALTIASKFFNSKFDLYWVPHFIPLDGVKSSKIVSTIHDLSFYLHPQWHPQERVEYFNKYFFKAIEKVDWIITVSEFSKNEIVKYLNYDENKITVIHNGVNQKLYKVYDASILNVTKIKFNLSDTFLLFVGSIEPRKNLLNLLKAYHLLEDEIKDTYPLILVGFKGWENKEIMQEIEKEKKHIRYLGYLSDEELAHVYNLATLFIYPSLYEGFGIPPLEAMASATAVISSDTSSLPEVCGDAAMYINPNKCEEITQSIQLLLSNKNKREELIEKGLQRVKEFTWEKSAKKHLEVFENLLQKQK